MAAPKFRMPDQSLILWETVDKHRLGGRVRSKRSRAGRSSVRVLPASRQAGGGEYVSTQNAHEGRVLTLSTGPELTPCTRAIFLQGKRKVAKTPAPPCTHSGGRQTMQTVTALPGR